MITGGSTGRRLIARSVSQSCNNLARHGDCIIRPGIHFPPWPSLPSLTNSCKRINTSHKTSVSSSQSLKQDRAVSASDRRNQATNQNEPDEWDSVVALEAARSKLDWRNQLKTDDQLEFESDLLHPHVPGTKLIDAHGDDLELWQELFLYRTRNYGIEGGSVVLERLLPVCVEHQIRIWELPRLWRAVEAIALQDKSLLLNLLTHIRQMSYYCMDHPDNYYRNVMFHILVETNESPKWWHERLRFLQPDTKEIELLFGVLCKHPGALKKFRSICFFLPSFTRMYASVVSGLVKSELYSEIWAWHNAMVEQNDVPDSLSSIQKSLKTLQKNGRGRLASNIVKSFPNLESKERSGESTGLRSISAPKSKPISLAAEGNSAVDAVRQLLEDNDAFQELLQDDRMNIDDESIATLIGTRTFALSAVLLALRAAGYESIGPLSFKAAIQQIAWKGPPIAEHARQAKELFDLNNMTVREHPWSRLILQFLNKSRIEMLDGILSIDRHPDVIGDIHWQQDNLSRYLQHRDQSEIELTMEILQILNPHHSENPIKDSVLRLKYQVVKGPLPLVVEELKQVLAAQDMITQSLFHEVWIRLFHRTPGRLMPLQGKQALSAFHILRTMMQNGHFVSPYYWRWLFKCLANGGQLGMLSRAATWLVSWCYNPSSRIFTSELQGGSRKRRKPFDWDTLLLRTYPVGHAKHFISRVFDKDMINGLITCGFSKHHRSLRLSGSWRTRYLLGSSDEKVRILMKDPSYWGFHLLKRLNVLGLEFDQFHGSIASGCRNILLSMFGPLRFIGASNGTSIRQDVLKRSRRAELVDYAEAMEKALDFEIFSFRKHAQPQARLQRFAESIIRLNCLDLQITHSHYKILRLKQNLAVAKQSFGVKGSMKQSDTVMVSAGNTGSTFGGEMQDGKTKHLSLDSDSVRRASSSMPKHHGDLVELPSAFRTALWHINRLPYAETDKVIAEYYPEYAVAYQGRPVPIGYNTEGMVVQRYPDLARISFGWVRRRKARRYHIHPIDAVSHRSLLR